MGRETGPLQVLSALRLCVNAKRVVLPAAIHSQIRLIESVQDIRVNRGNHRSPRNSRMSASVFFPNLTQPYTRATGSAPAILTATRRPFSSRKSSAVPALMPNFFRKILGMVTCPRSATVAFIKACLDEYGMKSYLTKIRPKTSYLSHE